MNSHNINSSDDQMMKNLFKGFEPKQAPDDLSKRIMQQVMAEWAVKPKVIHHSYWKDNLVFIVIGLILLTVFAFLFDYFALQGYANYLGLSVENNQLQFFYNNISKVGEWFSLIPSVYVYITIALAILLGIDNAVGKLSRT